MRQRVLSSSALLISALCGPAFAATTVTAVVTTTAVPGPPPATIYAIDICICMDSEDLIRYTEKGSRPVTVNVPESGILVKDEDSWLNAPDDWICTCPAMTVNIGTIYTQCPPSPPQCTTIWTSPAIPNSTWQDPNFPDTLCPYLVATGTVITIPGVGTFTL